MEELFKFWRKNVSVSQRGEFIALFWKSRHIFEKLHNASWDITKRFQRIVCYFIKSLLFHKISVRLAQWFSFKLDFLFILWNLCRNSVKSCSKRIKMYFLFRLKKKLGFQRTRKLACWSGKTQLKLSSHFIKGERLPDCP